MKNKDIICISISDWHMPWGSKQHLMAKLAQSNRVLYVEPQGSLLDFVKYPKYFIGRFNKINKLLKINENLHGYTPVPVFPFGRYFIFINKVNQAILCFILRRLIKRLGFKDPILWLYSPISADLIGKLHEDTVIYHCAADFVNEKGNYLRKKTISALEMCLVKQADIVLALTKELCRRFEKLNRNTCYFPSAVDLEYFEIIRDGNNVEPTDLYNINRPRLGVIGYLDGNILDVELLDYLAKANSRWSIVMIGPLFRNTKPLLKLKKNKNVYFLGEKSPDMIPVYLKYLDICLIPYVKNKFTNNISSIKLYEYLSMGKPVVSTLFSEEISDFKDIIGIADNNKLFLKFIREFLDCKDDKERFMARVNFVSGDTWQKRLEFLDEKICLCC